MAKTGREEISLFEWEPQKCEEHSLETYPRGCRDLLLGIPGRESPLTRGSRRFLILTIRCQSTVWQPFLIVPLLSFSVLSSPPLPLSFSLTFLHSLPLIHSFLTLSLSLSTPSTSIFSSPSLYHPAFSPSFPSLLTSFEVFLATKNVLMHQGFPVLYGRELKKQASQPLAFSFLGWLEAAY